ncbi:MAG: DNA-directed RNA polymerase subunit N [Candidatus Bathyarchaeota archaeon]|jgi:DNA-directed RNA polymerase subunit N
MIVPVRCFSCGKVIADKWESLSKRVSEGELAQDVLDDLGVERYCCRRMLLSHVELVDEILEFHEKRESVELRGER